jgi:hypothetical protein
MRRREFMAGPDGAGGSSGHTFNSQAGNGASGGGGNGGGGSASDVTTNNGTAGGAAQDSTAGGAGGASRGGAGAARTVRAVAVALEISLTQTQPAQAGQEEMVLSGTQRTALAEAAEAKAVRSRRVPRVAMAGCTAQPASRLSPWPKSASAM